MSKPQNFILYKPAVIAEALKLINSIKYYSTMENDWPVVKGMDRLIELLDYEGSDNAGKTAETMPDQ